jgi:UDP-N-acetylmuramoyl-tripeptide--D-alanyl-D-alanine ligase
MKEMPLFSAMKLLDITGGVLLQGNAEWSCCGISTDTRTLQEGNLFIALTGDHFDGHDCLEAAMGRGAAALLVRMRCSGIPDKMTNKLPVIGVNDTLTALGKIAHAWRQRFPIPVVAITGSSGKTTTKEMLTTIASRSRNVLSTKGNLNNQIGLPHTLLGLNRGHELAIVEMGTNRPGEILALAAIADPDIGLITNIGPAHLEGLGSLDAVRKEKGALLEVMGGRGTAVINLDDEAVSILARKWQGSRITFGLNPNADITARQIENAGMEGIRFNLVMAGTTLPIRMRASGRHNIQNALAASAAAKILGFDEEAIASGLATFNPVPGRMEIRRLGNGVYLIVDTYNANPDSMREALKTLRDLRGEGRSVAILGDMLELGESAEKWHEEIGRLIVETGVEAVFLKGNLSRSIASGAINRGFHEENIVFFDHPSEALIPLRNRLKTNDWVLLKGSRRMKMETVADLLTAAFDPKAQTV